jgi:hypothetical protein
MSEDKIDPNRREFLAAAVPMGILGCLGCPKLSALALSASDGGQSLQDRAKLDSGMTFEEVYHFAYRDGFIPLAKQMAVSMGQEPFMKVLGEAGLERGREAGAALAASSPNNDLATFAETMRAPPPLYEGALTFEIVEDSPNAFEVKISECLWARTFREADAADIGYACICHPDYTFAEGFNPSMKMIRTKTLMQGHDCCDHRWVVEE